MRILPFPDLALSRDTYLLFIPLSAKFAYQETGVKKKGDSYYVRIEQANGVMVWSSPIWVGND